MEKPPYNEEKKARRKLYGRSDEVKNDIGTLLRLYAIRVESEKDGEPPAYIITGGGIKFSDKMGRMKELNQEYSKMLSVQKWLSAQGITTKESLYALNDGRNDEC